MNIFPLELDEIVSVLGGLLMVGFQMTSSLQVGKEEGSAIMDQ